MLAVLENVISTLVNDSSIQVFVSDRVYPEGVDMTNETVKFPLITVHNISEVTKTNPRGERECLVQVSIWSRLNQLEVENIAERVLQLLNFQQFNSGYGSSIQRWQREEAGVDLFESDRRIWHKALTFRAWSRP